MFRLLVEAKTVSLQGFSVQLPDLSRKHAFMSLQFLSFTQRLLPPPRKSGFHPLLLGGFQQNLEGGWGTEEPIHTAFLIIWGLKGALCVTQRDVTPAVKVSFRSAGEPPPRQTDRQKWGSYPAEPSLVIGAQLCCSQLRSPASLYVHPMSYFTQSHTLSSQTPMSELPVCSSDTPPRWRFVSNKPFL